jgi:DNA-binding transcriptional regulator YiaG
MQPNEVRRIRLRLGLTQAKFAEVVGVARVTVVCWETGRHGIRESAARLMRLLEKSGPVRTPRKER